MEPTALQRCPLTGEDNAWEEFERPDGIWIGRNVNHDNQFMMAEDFETLRSEYDSRMSLLLTGVPAPDRVEVTHISVLDPTVTIGE